MDVLLEKMRDAEPSGGGEDAFLDHFGSDAPASEREGDFVAHIQGEELLFRILKERAHVFGKVCYGR